MAYTNSSLVNYKKLSPNNSGARNHAIDTVSIHCVVGQCSVETLGNIFADSSKEASSNYGIGYDGKIGLYVEEKNRSWCTSSSENDNRAITIEVASDTYSPYAVNDKAYNSLINLLVDICKRNNIKKLVWSTNKSDRINHKNGCNMTVHRDYANKSCPGDYLYNRHGDIANKVNAKLETSTESEDDEMKLGSNNDATLVFKQLIMLLREYGLISTGVDDNGVYGTGTVNACKEIQKKAGCTVDGIPGPITIRHCRKMLRDYISDKNKKITNAKNALK